MQIGTRTRFFQTFRGNAAVSRRASSISANRLWCRRPTVHPTVYCAPICRPDQANRVTAGTSASSIAVVHGTGCQSNKAGLRRSGKDSASVRPTLCAIHPTDLIPARLQERARVLPSHGRQHYLNWVGVVKNSQGSLRPPGSSNANTRSPRPLTHSRSPSSPSRLVATDRMHTAGTLSTRCAPNAHRELPYPVSGVIPDARKPFTF